MAETRVIGSPGRKIGGGSGRPPAPVPEQPAAAPPQRRRRGVLVVVALAVAAVLAAGAFFFLRPSTSEALPEETEPPEPGITVAVEPRNINLAGGHYLRMGFAIELVAEAEEIPTAQATDIAIALYSGRTVEEVNDPELRAELKSELTDRLAAAYDGQVMAVYLTDFVTQ